MERVILELSLKPFRDNSDEGVRQVCAEILRQWNHLLHSAEQISFLLWTADGSEILEYRGQLSEEVEWAKWIGIANHASPEWTKGFECLHNKRWSYIENPPVFTYERLQFVVRALKEATQNTFLGRKVSVGTIFDPGPEFAESSFKYKRHTEISYGDIMGESQWVHCAAVLHADNETYAGFPEGIAEGTTLGTFLGRQSQHFLTDLGFDYIWFSNGFGYSLSSWNVTGEVFDGETFNRGRVTEVRDSILRFWNDFRRECPDFPIETRGSNLSTAMDLSSDASPVEQIYRGGFHLVAPVNSPWAALNGDYGLELVGWMSHIAELPEGSGVPFRYYIHDPWWLNSPWIERYGSEPHDIYLPLSLGRMDAEGAITRPASVSMLTIDDSYGQMPESVPVEVVPHLRRALEDFPDAPGLLTWIYPFDEYHQWTFGAENRAPEVFFGDWFMRAAVNQGFPLNTVVSTRNFLSAYAQNQQRFDSTILVCPLPDEGSDLANALVKHLDGGGKVLLYGPLRYGDERLIEALDLQIAPEISGELKIHTQLRPDRIADADFPNAFQMRPLISGGGAEAKSKNPSSNRAQILAEVEDEHGEKRVFSAFAQVEGGGQLGWVRGAFCESVSKHSSLPIADNPSEWFRAERLMRWALQSFGCSLRFDKPSLQTPDPLILAARARNGWFFSGYSPSTNCTLHWRLGEGVPVPVGCDVLLREGVGAMTLSRAWHRECRVFVEQSETSEISCRESVLGEVGVSRRLLVRGLKEAHVRFFADPAFPDTLRFQKNNAYNGQGTPIPFERESPHVFRSAPISGDLLISW